jgi:exonuclease SbcC
MRPLQLELEGFASFRERTLIDFGDADLFVLSGPMGAGKSSIIDALGFALYGSIARFHNLSLVAPVISQGLPEARVRLLFRLGDEEFTAVRVVRRNRSGGATTAEARLQRGIFLEEGDADNVTNRVTELLGLNFEQFTKCVVLPQGEFADLLHAKPAERQELLVRLLDIGFYRNIGSRAGRLRERSQDAAKLLRGRLDSELCNATAEAYEEQSRRVARLADLYARLEAEQEVLDGLAKQAEGYRAEARVAGERVALLSAIKVPAGISDLNERIREAECRTKDARDAAAEASRLLEDARQVRADLGERASVEALISQYQEQCEASERVEACQRQVADAIAAQSTTELQLTGAQEALEAAQTAKDGIERAHSAFHAARGLKAGDICPVCGETLAASPTLAEPEGLAQAAQRLEAARKQLRGLEAAYKQASERTQKSEAALSFYEQRLKELEAQLDSQPPPSNCRELLEQIDIADSALVQARHVEHMAAKALDAAESELRTAAIEAQQAMTVFNAARDKVASLGAPAAADNLEASWQALSAWAKARSSEQERLIVQARESEDGAIVREKELLAQQVEACRAAGVEVAGRRARDATLEAKVRAEEERKRIDAQLAERAGVERDLSDFTETSRKAGMLSLHLRADHFERWYLQEALTRLVRGATDRLRELSNDQYSLDLNRQKTDFVVIDHINANEERPVRTLSGGETFLASVALALALGNDIASLAAKGGARLDALFLDEGFGSLDADTLETVASTIEELGARGRMVGIVTHVRELADRIPVQYQVTKVGGSSRVERVEAR